jgi:hypothetical protein
MQAKFEASVARAMGVLVQRVSAPKASVAVATTRRRLLQASPQTTVQLTVTDYAGEDAAKDGCTALRVAAADDSLAEAAQSNGVTELSKVKAGPCTFSRVASGDDAPAWQVRVGGSNLGHELPCGGWWHLDRTATCC